MAAKGKWAQGIEPRNFAWVMKDRLAVSERPGGYGVNHRRVRRQEEIIWIREQGFTCVISMIPSTHNLHNYEELGVTYRHRPMELLEDPEPSLAEFYPELHQMLGAGEKILLHGEELNDRISGLMAGYLVWADMVPSGPRATSLIERILHRQIGPTGRELVAVSLAMAGRRGPASGPDVA